MSRELWAVEKCPHGFNGSCEYYCKGGNSHPLDFDAIWTRYYDTANRRSEAGLTYDELKQVVLGGTDT